MLQCARTYEEVWGEALAHDMQHCGGGAQPEGGQQRAASLPGTPGYVHKLFSVQILRGGSEAL
eukprot:1160493-Pelagomonas_calceolata.AAC.4